MKNHNDQAMKNYFSSMLNEKAVEGNFKETIVDEADEQLEGLHSAVPVLPETLVFSEQQEVTESAAEQLPATQQTELPAVWKNLEVENEFQALFFELAGLTFAVPLVDLGGIHHLD